MSENIHDNPYSFDAIWSLVQAFYKDESFNSSNIQSYNDFVRQVCNRHIPPIEVETQNPQSCHYGKKYIIQVVATKVGIPRIFEDDPNRKGTSLKAPGEKSRLNKPKISFPNECRLRNLVYSAPITFDIYHEKYSKTEKGYEIQDERKWHMHVHIGDIPVMLGSEYDILNTFPEIEQQTECPMDTKGYFIINGMERPILRQARMRTNHIFVFSKISTGMKTTLIAETRSLEENDDGNPAVFLMRFRFPQGKTEQTFKVKLPFVKFDFGLATVMRALGLNSDRMILEHICQDGIAANSSESNVDTRFEKACEATLVEGFQFSQNSQRDALITIAQKANIHHFENEDKDAMVNYAINLLNRDLFPHMGQTQESFPEKAYFLGLMAYRILLVHLKYNEPDTRDHCAHRRYDDPGELMKQL